MIRFGEDGSFDEETTNQLLAKRLEDSKGAVIPGFYGAKADGTIVTFSRGGCDPDARFGGQRIFMRTGRTCPDF